MAKQRNGSSMSEFGLCSQPPYARCYGAWSDARQPLAPKLWEYIDLRELLADRVSKPSQ
jgi:hypothetical protein